ncbi:hypothetical protein [Bacillus cihuensis]|uniref:hypothetical protein n=1 Tax=Bacillus cihuensis TaxID=1208599 RepID=UPI000403FB8A|nr:hypothetical protein [Bacillus cihuensis]
MVWFFVLLTVVTYSFVMKYVLSFIASPQKAQKNLAQKHIVTKNNQAYIPTPTTR